MDALEVEQHRCMLLAQALGDLLVALGYIIPGMPLTGPQLLNAAAEATAACRHESTQPVDIFDLPIIRA